MAYAALVSTVQLLQQTTAQNYAQYSLLFPHQHSIQSLFGKFSSFLVFLEEASDFCSEERIRDAAYRAQDIVESYISNVISSQKRISEQNPRRILSAVQKETMENYRVEFSVKLERDLQGIVQEVDSIIEQATKTKFMLSNSMEDSSFDDFPRYGGWRRMGRGGKASMVGFDEDLMKIMDQLCGGESSKLQVIPIVGMAGIGKTTLANNVFYDPLIECRFDIRAWTTITQNHKAPEVLLDLINSLPIVNDDLRRETEQVLAECLYKSLKGRRYLIVLDDIWSTKAWDDVRRFFPNDDNGSRIILTTRLDDVATYANPSGSIHKVHFLNEDQSWNLLRHKVFGEECCPPELVDVGKSIAKNCRGLPLSIVLVAGVLSKLRIKHRWEHIARSVRSTVTANDEQFSSKILSLSYNHLPRHLKPCFLYLGNFPEDHKIPVFKLITLWIAEGFLKPMGSKSLEEVAEKYLEDLAKRSLVIMTNKNCNGRFKFCSIHDLVRDLCVGKAWDERFLHVIDGTQETIESIRRVCFSNSIECSNHSTILNITDSTIRTIFCSAYTELLTNARLLRVLDVLEIVLEGFPVEIFELFHLRYLSFTTGFIRHGVLPPLMAEHQNLQTIIMGSSVKSWVTETTAAAAYLPIWKMPQLRHLIFKDLTLCPLSYPVGVDEEHPVLENLQTLSRVKNFKFTKTAIDAIPNLKNLKAVYTSDVRRYIFKYGLHNLVHLQDLETLNLRFQPSSQWWVNALPVRFHFPEKLRELTLRGCGLPWKDISRAMGLLPNLEALKLLRGSAMGKKWEAVEGEFERLKLLVMEDLDLKHWVAESGHFPRLEHLMIKRCMGLEGVPSEIGDIPTLQVIEVNDISQLAVMSVMVILEEQRCLANDGLRIRIDSQWK